VEFNAGTSGMAEGPREGFLLAKKGSAQDGRVEILLLSFRTPTEMGNAMRKAVARGE